MKTKLEIEIEYDPNDKLWCVTCPGVVSPSSTLHGAMESFAEDLSYVILKHIKSKDEEWHESAMPARKEMQRIFNEMQDGNIEAPWDEECI